MSFFTKPEEYPDSAQQREIFLYRIKWLVIFRIVLVTILLGSALIIQLNLNKSRPLELLYLFIILSYVFTAITLYFLKRVNNLTLYVYFQIIYDLLFETGIVYITGGVESVFTFTYIFTIIAASILLLRQGAFIAASLSTILYGTLVNLQFYHILPLYISVQLPFTTVNSSAIYYNIFLNSCAFYLIAFLSSYLSESLKRTHQRLRETSHDLTELQTFHHNILQSMHSGVLTTDLQGKITSYNHAAELITGYTLSEVYGCDLQEIFPELDTSQFMGSMAYAYKAVRRLETTIMTRSRTKVYLGLSVSPFLDNTAKTSGLICIFQDLTELKDMEEQIARADRLAAVGQLAAGVAHEIRNPLASISGAIQMLRSELELSEDNKALMEIILRESTRLDAILSDFLNYARPKTLTFTKCDILHEVILSTIGLLQRDKRFPEGKIAIHVDSTPNFPKLVCDVQQIQQVFWNLVLNALQAMPNGGTLGICTQLEKLEKWELGTHGPIYAGVISVSDTGGGIDEETVRHIFHPFYTTKKNGTGLGLAIAHSIIKNHHGTIKVKSSLEQGTTFDVILPLQQEYW
jgi:two-component system sensor histidine kinase PilS (NtrC family)